MLNAFRAVLMWPISKWREVTLNVSKRTPLQKWCLVRDFCDSLVRILGVNVLNDCKRNWRTPLAGFCAIQYAIFTLYTAWFYWNENKITSIQPFSVTAMVIGVMYAISQPMSRHVGRSSFRFSSLCLRDF